MTLSEMPEALVVHSISGRNCDVSNVTMKAILAMAVGVC